MTAVICETIEREIERSATTEDEAVELVRGHLGGVDLAGTGSGPGSVDDGSGEALERAIALWCRRFDVEIPDMKQGHPGAAPGTVGAVTARKVDRLAVAAKWVFWVIQARTLLRARFDSRKPESGEGGETETDDAEGALEDMVLGEWAEELEVGLQDLGDIYNDPTR